MNKEEIRALINELGLTVEFTFDSGYNKGKKLSEMGLQYSAVANVGKAVIKTPYSMGVAHAPSYKPGRLTIDDAETLKKELTTGYTYKHKLQPMGRLSVPIYPDPVDFWYCIVSDSDVLSYNSFEDWAPNLGYDPDSRSAEAIYRKCLEHALTLRNSLGEVNFKRLQDAYQDY